MAMLSLESQRIAVLCILLARTSIQEEIADDGPGVVAGYEGVYAKVLKRSGRIIIATTKKVSDDSDRITLEFESLEEKNMYGKSFPLPNRLKNHSFSNFPSLEFNLSSIVNSDWMHVPARQFSVSAILHNGATVNVSVYVFKENRLVNISEEDLDIKSGNIKINIAVKNWPFCIDIENSICGRRPAYQGKYLDFVLVLKSKSKPTQMQKKWRRGVRFDTGNNSTFVLSEKVSYNSGDWVNLPDGYPIFEEKGSKNTFTFRFKKFESSVLYDPLVDLGIVPTKESPTVVSVTETRSVSMFSPTALHSKSGISTTVNTTTATSTVPSQIHIDALEDGPHQIVWIAVTVSVCSVLVVVITVILVILVHRRKRLLEGTNYEIPPSVRQTEHVYDGLATSGDPNKEPNYYLTPVSKNGAQNYENTQHQPEKEGKNQVETETDYYNMELRDTEAKDGVLSNGNTHHCDDGTESYYNVDAVVVSNNKIE